MQTRKILGYILAILGLVGIIITSLPQAKSLLPFPIPPELTDISITVISIVLIIIGASLVFKKSQIAKQMEVPIFHGKKIVGYRRH